jgi:hypothetical protein
MPTPSRAGAGTQACPLHSGAGPSGGRLRPAAADRAAALRPGHPRRQGRMETSRAAEPRRRSSSRSPVHAPWREAVALGQRRARPEAGAAPLRSRQGIGFPANDLSGRERRSGSRPSRTARSRRNNLGAAAWQRRRLPWVRGHTGPESQVYLKSHHGHGDLLRSRMTGPICADRRCQLTQPMSLLCARWRFRNSPLFVEAPERVSESPATLETLVGRRHAQGGLRPPVARRSCLGAWCSW